MSCPVASTVLVGVGDPNDAVGDQLPDLAVVIAGLREDLGAVLAQQRRRRRDLARRL
jgi:hypothetical protein